MSRAAHEVAGRSRFGCLESVRYGRSWCGAGTTAEFSNDPNEGWLSYSGVVNPMLLQPSAFDRAVGVRFAELRAEAGMDLHELAVLSRIGYWRTRRILKGFTRVSVIEFRRLCLVFQIDPARMYEELYVEAAVTVQQLEDRMKEFL